jgi:hypothetical protein
VHCFLLWRGKTNGAQNLACSSQLSVPTQQLTTLQAGGNWGKSSDFWDLNSELSDIPNIKYTARKQLQEVQQSASHGLKALFPQ